MPCTTREIRIPDILARGRSSNLADLEVKSRTLEEGACGKPLESPDGLLKDLRTGNEGGWFTGAQGLAITNVSDGFELGLHSTQGAG